MNRRGFSLVEIAVAVAVVLLMVVVIGAFQHDIFFLNSVLSSSLAAQDEARRLFKTASAEIRSASPSALGAYAISEASANALTFYSDLNNDGLSERVRYYLSGNGLNKGVLSPSGNPVSYNPANEVVSTVAQGVLTNQGPIFSYFDSSYDGTGSALPTPINIASVRLVKIDLWLDRDTNRPPSAQLMTTQVAMRNLKDNL